MVLAVAVGGGYLVQRSANQARTASIEAALPDDFSLLREARVSRAIADRSDAAMAAADAKAKADAAARDAAEKAKKASTRTGGSGDSSNLGYPTPNSCNDYTGNRLLGCQLMLQWGFGLDQMPCLDRMWTKESGWNPRAENQSSHSYGIPQALPADKMKVYGSDWKTNPVPQIKWGLDYIKKRYGTPCGAWSFWLSHNWY
jgi:hypothetical protein